jgi:ribonuclease J
MVSITAYAGVRTIGGNKILLEDGDTRLFFDFGTDYKVRSLYFEEYLKPRAGVGLRDVLEMGLAPPLEGLYREDMLPAAGFWERYRSRPGHCRIEHVDGVLVSHAHLDHSGAVSFLRPDIPILASAMTGVVAKAIQDSGKTSDFETEVCFVTPRVVEGERLTTAPWKTTPYVRRPFRFPDMQEPSPEIVSFWNRAPGSGRQMGREELSFGVDRVGGLPVRLYPLDHSIHGASAWAVETSCGWVVYTGDFRLHGTRGQETKRFVAAARELRPRVLLCEGTRAARETAEDTPTAREEDVLHSALQEVRSEDGLVIADFGPRNVDRLLTFYHIAEETDRLLVILAKDAYLLDAMHLVSPEVPALTECPRIRIFYDLKAKRDAWEERVWKAHQDKKITPQEAAADLNRLILCFSFWDVDNLIDLKPRGGKYIYSSSEAYTEEQMIDMDRLRNWLAHFHMTGMGLPFRLEDGTFGVSHPTLHASGHAPASDLVAVIKEIAPEILIPIHTEHPQYFVEALRGEPIEIRLPGEPGTPQYAQPIRIQ